MGSLVFVRGKPTRAVIGLALATFFTAIYTLSNPYSRKPLANLSFAAMWCACLASNKDAPSPYHVHTGKSSGSMQAA